MDLFFWSSFLKEKEKDLRRVARATEGGMSAEEMQNDAWVVANEIGVKRGEPVDFTNPIDQDAIIAKLYVKHVIRADKRLKYAVRIDRDEESDDGSYSWSPQIIAQGMHDPLEILVAAEEDESRGDHRHPLACTFSEFAAYLITLWHFYNRLGLVCKYLMISRGTLSRRIDVAKVLVEMQPSLFDRLEIIDESFMPLRGQAYAVRQEQHLGGQQLGWDFAPI